MIQAQKDYSKENELLLGWYKVVSQSNFDSLDDLNKTFGMINISHSNYFLPIPNSKLIAKVFINFPAKVLLINEIVPI